MHAPKHAVPVVARLVLVAHHDGRGGAFRRPHRLHHAPHQRHRGARVGRAEVGHVERLLPRCPARFSARESALHRPEHHGLGVLNHVVTAFRRLGVESSPFCAVGCVLQPFLLHRRRLRAHAAPAHLDRFLGGRRRRQFLRHRLRGKPRRKLSTNGGLRSAALALGSPAVHVLCRTSSLLDIAAGAGQEVFHGFEGRRGFSVFRGVHGEERGCFGAHDVPHEIVQVQRVRLFEGGFVKVLHGIRDHRPRRRAPLGDVAGPRACDYVVGFRGGERQVGGAHDEVRVHLARERVGEEPGLGARHLRVALDGPPLRVGREAGGAGGDVDAPRDVGPPGHDVDGVHRGAVLRELGPHRGAHVAAPVDDHDLAGHPALRAPEEAGVDGAQHAEARASVRAHVRVADGGEHEVALVAQHLHVVEVGVHVAARVHGAVEAPQELGGLAHQGLLVDLADLARVVGRVAHHFGAREPGVEQRVLHFHTLGEAHALLFKRLN
mmetsp:Transcript_35494/g.72332  ORF Transcript_35494/g.72332 Transcript_35494/m.72332 type:complete len:492 (+) Transcript_35494:1121-2596(+)